MKADKVDKIITLANIADRGYKLTKEEKASVNSCQTREELAAYESIYP